MDCQKIYDEAVAAARKAVMDEVTARPEDPRAFDCGFAWVTIKPARGPFVSFCKSKAAELRSPREQQAYGSLRDYGGGGWQFWKPGDFAGQSIRIHEAGAKAFAAVLQANGLKAEWGSRLD